MTAPSREEATSRWLEATSFTPCRRLIPRARSSEGSTSTSSRPSPSLAISAGRWNVSAIAPQPITAMRVTPRPYLRDTYILDLHAWDPHPPYPLRLREPVRRSRHEESGTTGSTRPTAERVRRCGKNSATAAVRPPLGFGAARGMDPVLLERGPGPSVRNRASGLDRRKWSPGRNLQILRTPEGS